MDLAGFKLLIIAFFDWAKVKAKGHSWLTWELDHVEKIVMHLIEMYLPTDQRFSSTAGDLQALLDGLFDKAIAIEQAKGGLAGRLAVFALKQVKQVFDDLFASFITSPDGQIIVGKLAKNP